jgi:hemolysin activation/secretion protein
MAAAVLGAPAASFAADAPGPRSAPAAAAAASGDILLVVTRYDVTGPNPLGAEETAAVLSAHLGEHRSLSSLEAGALALENAMRERGFAFHRVIVPAQRPEGGVVRLEVLRFSLGAVNVSGNRHFTAANIMRSLPALAPGVSPDVVELARQLSLANEHPAKRLTVTMRESKASDALDADVVVRDVKPSQFFAGIVGNSRDEYNLVNRNTGYTRLTLGYQNSNLFDRDHVGTLAYTTSPENLDAVQQYAAYYSLPVYALSSQVAAYYVQSDIDTGSIPVGGLPFNVSGRGKFYGARITYTLPRVADTTQLLSVAYDVRGFDNTVGAPGLVLPGTPVTTRPLSLRYQARAERQWGGASGYVEHAVNISGSDSGNFAAARAGATDDWNAWRVGFDANYTWGTWVLSTRLRGQVTGDYLIAGEQFGLGGVASVRGLREREYAGERGYSATLEGIGPALLAGVRPVVFLDHGYAYQRAAPAPVPGAITGGQSASSAGIGARWNWQRQLDVSTDLAYVLDGLPGSPGTQGTSRGHVKLHFSVYLRF